MPDPWSYAKASEHSHQASLFMWANMAQRFGLYIANDPHSYTQAGFAQTQFDNRGKLGYLLASEPVTQLKWLHAIHNQGHGDAIRGAKAKAKIGPEIASSYQGSYLQSYLCCGFYLELKIGKGLTSDKQDEFADDMRQAGYATGVAWGWLEARNLILDYLGLPLYPMPTS
jgi:hypothetical protein